MPTDNMKKCPCGHFRFLHRYGTRNCYDCDCGKFGVGLLNVADFNESELRWLAAFREEAK